MPKTFSYKHVEILGGEEEQADDILNALSLDGWVVHTVKFWTPRDRDSFPGANYLLKKEDDEV